MYNSTQILAEEKSVTFSYDEGDNRGYIGSIVSARKCPPLYTRGNGSRNSGRNVTQPRCLILRLLCIELLTNSLHFLSFKVSWDMSEDIFMICVLPLLSKLLTRRTKTVENGDDGCGHTSHRDKNLFHVLESRRMTSGDLFWVFSLPSIVLFATRFKKTLHYVSFLLSKVLSR